MVTSQTNEVIQHLRRAVLLRDGAGLTDGQLLEEYLSRRDEAALAALVRRHAPMVWGVCRRILRNHHDAEDAFQATFLVLVRKAASIVPREMVANWVYGVAHQTALKARATAAKRRTREKQVTEMPEPAVAEQDLWNDLQPLLDQELSRLPDKYRVAIVLCDLEGKTRKEAARQLGVPEGTLAARLARARGLLAKRLARHGLAVSGAALAAALSQHAASAGAPTAVVSNAIKGATLYAAGQAVAGVISAQVVALTQEVLTTMFRTKLKAATLALVLAGFLVSGFFVGALLRAPQAALAQQPVGEKKAKPADKGTPAKTPDWLKVRMTLKDHGTGVCALAFSPDDKLLATGSDDFSIKIWDTTTGKEVKTLTGHQDMVVSLVFSPDGKTLASTSMNLRGATRKQPGAVKLWDVATWEEKVQLKDNDGTFRRAAFSPDGKVLAVSELLGWSGGPGLPDQVKLWETSTGKQLGTLKEEERCLIRTLVFSPDGKTLILGTRPPPPGSEAIRLWNWAEQKAGGSLKMDGECRKLRFTRDGKTLVTMNEHGEVTFWDFENWQERKTVKVIRTGTEPRWMKGPGALSLSPDEKLVARGYATGRDGAYAGSVDLWDTASGQRVATLALDTVVDNVVFSPGGGMLAAACLKNARRESAPSAVWLQGEGGVVRIWDLQAPRK